MNMIDLCVGIDYSGAEAPTSRLKGLQVFSARPKEMCEKWLGPAVSNNGKPLNWTRAEIAQMLLEQARQGVGFLAGIHHGFSFPSSDFKRYCLKSWPEFMADFVHHWPTDGDHVYVDFVRDGVLHGHADAPPPGQRVGETGELRLC